MGAIWLACCSCSGFNEVQRVIEGRFERPQIFRSEDSGTLRSVARALGDAGTSFAACVRLSDEARAESVIGELRAESASAEVIAIVDRADPAHVARLFLAGASEVVVAGDSLRSGKAMSGTCVEDASGKEEPPAGSDRIEFGSGTSRETVGLTAACKAEATHDRASRSRAVRDLASDLDEPDYPPGETSSIPSLADRGGLPSTGPEGGTEARRDEAAAELANGVGSIPRFAEAKARRNRPMGAGGAPVVVFTHARGGCGSTTLVAALAHIAAKSRLRTAVLDLDLMFGNLSMMLGAKRPGDLSLLVDAARRGCLREQEIVSASSRVEAGLTLWGPVEAPERAELVGPSIELLIDTLRCESDLIVVDTSSHWSDAVACAVAAASRCVVMVGPGPDMVPASMRLVGLMTRIGVPRTGVTCVFNRFDARSGGEDARSRFEFRMGLGPVASIADGGSLVGELAGVGDVAGLLELPGAFQSDVRRYCANLLDELGCPVRAELAREGRFPPPEGRPRIRFPWRKAEGGRG